MSRSGSKTHRLWHADLGREAKNETVVYGNDPRLDNIVKYISDAASVSVVVVCIWPIVGRRRRPVRPTWPLIAWLMAALVAFHILLNLVSALALG